MFRLLACLLSLLALPALAAAPGASDWFETEQGRVRLVAASPTDLGLEFQMAPGWKIYWRSPGDAGYPPSIDWRGSENLAGAELRWPAPKRFTLFGLDTVGYEGGVVLPIEAAPVDPAAPLHLRASVDYLTCQDICIPYQAELTLDGTDPTHAALIGEWQAKVPRAEWPLEVEGAVLRRGTPPVLELALGGPFTAPDVFVEGPEGLVFGRPVAAAGRLQLRVEGENPDRIVGQMVTLTVVDGRASAETALTVAAGPPLADFSRLLPILGLALLGGLILNVMPCVLTVLSLKLLGMAGGARSLLATAAGIVVSFLVLAAAMIGLKGAGVAVGWGVQFQQPVFLTLMMGVVVLFACNLWGFFEVPMPPWADRLAGGKAGAFATGAFATLLATPCTAPFLGTAVGFALAAGPLEITLVFLALGVGMAAPYLVVAAIPGAARMMPRPGRWMLNVKRALALLLAATAVWLASVLFVQVGLAATLLVLLLTATIVLLMLAFRTPARRVQAASAAIAAAAIVAAVAPTQAGSAGPGAGWDAFDRAAIEAHVAAGRVVFVDVTADWCLTCQVNKKLVLDVGAVRERLAAPGVVPMRADWTRPDPRITEYLRSFGRYGIPFNAVYGPSAPQGIALPELLTDDAVLEALTRAAGSPKAPPSERAVATAKVGASPAPTKGEKP